MFTEPDVPVAQRPQDQLYTDRSFLCPYCRAVLALRSEKAGESLRCASCDMVVNVPPDV